jgi:phosphoglycerol transferase MdoB-like AlkP superfamily enzyme
LPLVLLAFVQQEEGRTFALPGDEVFTLQAALVGPVRDRPRETAFEAGYLSWQLTSMLSLFVAYLVVFVVDYSLYLLLPQLEPTPQDKEGKNRRFSHRSTLRWVQYVAHSVYMFLLFFAIGAVLGYVCLVFTWALLASVVNPVRFLALTTTVAGAAGAIFGRFQSMASLQKQMSRKVVFNSAT